MQNDLLRRAEDIAMSAHAGQTDKTGRPFTDHLRRVVEKVGGRDQKMVAYLHDIVEKADGWSVKRLADEGFPQPVIDAVDAMTRRQGEDYADFVRRHWQGRSSGPTSKTISGRPNRLAPTIVGTAWATKCFARLRLRSKTSPCAAWGFTVQLISVFVHLCLNDSVHRIDFSNRE
jgi:hypothetical protein